MEKDVYERYLLRENLANSRPEDAQPERPLWVYCALSAFSADSINMSRRGLSRVAYPGQGMREPSRGIGESRAPTSFHAQCLTLNPGGYRQRKEFLCMAEKITAEELFERLSNKLDLIHNLRCVYIGIMADNVADGLNEEERPCKKYEIAFGEQEVIRDGQIALLDFFKQKNSNSYKFAVAPDSLSVGTSLYVILDIDVSQDYSADDLFDTDVFDEPFMLVK